MLTLAMEHMFTLKLFALCVLVVSNSRCHEFVTLGLPSRPSYSLHPPEELKMDLSEVHPLFLYAASQNEFARQHIHEHILPRPLYPPGPQFVHPQPHRPTNPQSQQRGKPASNPSLAYGFLPKPSTRHANQHHQGLKKLPGQNGKPRTKPIQRHAFQPIRIPHRKGQFKENIQVQASVQKTRQNTQSQPSRNSNSHLQNSANRNLHQPSNRRAPNKSLRPANSHMTGQGNQRDGHRQGSPSFADAVRAFSNRNVHDLKDDYSLLPPRHFSNLHLQNHQVQNERMNMQQHVRGMRVEDRPQLPPRPYHSGGIVINTAAGELPNLSLDSFNKIDGNPGFREGKNLHKDKVEDSGKKTYLLFKAPHASATTETPTFVLENLRDAPSFILNGLTETTLQLPDIFPTAEPITLPRNHEAPIVLDLVQIPDPALFGRPHQKHAPESVRNHNFRNEASDAHRHSADQHHRFVNRANEAHRYNVEPVRNHNFGSEAKDVQRFNVDPVQNHNFGNQADEAHRYNVESVQNHNFGTEAKDAQRYSVEPVRNHNFGNQANEAHRYNVESVQNHNFGNQVDGAHRYNVEAVQNHNFGIEAKDVQRFNVEHARNHDFGNQADEAHRYNPEPVHHRDIGGKANDAHIYNAATPAYRPFDHQHHEREPDIGPKTEAYHHEGISSDNHQTNAQEHQYTSSSRPYVPQEENIYHYNVDPIPSPETTPTDRRKTDHSQYFSHTESYPTTPLGTYDDQFYKTSPSQFDSETQHRAAIPRPKLKELKKPLNTSSHQPISFSSSVSIVSVKQSVDAKPLAHKKPKQSVKKALPTKKKTKTAEDVDYADYDHFGDQSVPGEAGIDYPTYKDIPSTSFSCMKFKAPGFYADLDTGCQIFHNCDTGMSKHSFMCPNGTIFHQELHICDWWYNVKCDESREFYSLNFEDDNEKRL